VNLRPATPEDAPAITMIQREAFRVSLPFLPARHAHRAKRKADALGESARR